MTLTPYILKISGTVIKGLGLGSRLGFPTINIKIESAPGKNDFGVYAVKVKISGKRKIFTGVAHYGPRKIHNAPVSFEVHLLSAKENLYGKKVTVEILRKIRDIKDFASEKELKKQIKLDVDEVKNETMGF